MNKKFLLDAIIHSAENFEMDLSVFNKKRAEKQIGGDNVCVQNSR